MKLLEDFVQNKYGKFGSYVFYRCLTCQKILTKKDIEAGGCTCTGKRLSPTNLTLWEELKVLWRALWM